MSEPHDPLSRARLELRRAEGTWGNEPPAAADAHLAAARSHISAAASLQEPSRLDSSNRGKPLKRALLRFTRFYTDKQSRFNARIVQALRDLARALEDSQRRATLIEGTQAGLQAVLERQEERLSVLEQALGTRTGPSVDPPAAPTSPGNRES